MAEELGWRAPADLLAGDEPAPMPRADAAEIYELHARVCEAIADGKRLLIINELRDGPRTVGEVVAALEIPQANASGGVHRSDAVRPGPDERRHRPRVRGRHPPRSVILIRVLVTAWLLALTGILLAYSYWGWALLTLAGAVANIAWAYRVWRATRR